MWRPDCFFFCPCPSNVLSLSLHLCVSVVARRCNFKSHQSGKFHLSPGPLGLKTANVKMKNMRAWGIKQAYQTSLDCSSPLHEAAQGYIRPTSITNLNIQLICWQWSCIVGKVLGFNEEESEYLMISDE